MERMVREIKDGSGKRYRVTYQFKRISEEEEKLRTRQVISIFYKALRRKQAENYLRDRNGANESI